ncbi:MAG: aconitase X [[Clostridium] scindens]
MMNDRMKLSKEQEAILNGSQGEVMAKVMETLVRYGELFGADGMVPITSQYNHLVTSFGLKALGPVYDLMEKSDPCRVRVFTEIYCGSKADG